MQMTDIAIMLRKSRKASSLSLQQSRLTFGKAADEIYEFYNLGLGDPSCQLSATQC